MIIPCSFGSFALFMAHKTKASLLRAPRIGVPSSRKLRRSLPKVLTLFPIVKLKLVMVEVRAFGRIFGLVILVFVINFRVFLRWM